MIKKIVIKNDPNLRIKIDIKLDEMELTIQRKLESLDIVDDYSEYFIIDTESKIDEIMLKFYQDYLKLKEIEEFWKQELDDAKVVEFEEEKD